MDESVSSPGASEAALRAENASLRTRLEEAEEILRAISAGEVDCLAINGRVYSLEGAETPYRMLVEAMHQGAATLAPDGTILYCNGRLASLMQIPLEAIFGRSLPSLVAPASRPDFDALLAQGRQEATEGEVMLQRDDDSQVPVQLAFSRLMGDGAPGLCVVVTELSERKQNEARIAASLREKEVLLKEIHHRVKNNLQVIASLLRLQADSLSDPAARDSILDSQRRVQSMALVHEHLYQSSGLASINMAKYISTLVNSTRRSYSQFAASIEISIMAEEIELDIERAVPLGLIISELVSNSFKHAFMPPANSTREIWVKLTKNNSTGLTLEVGDNGRGIPEDKDIAKPSSMGLILVHAFILQLNGQLTVQRRPGTIFSLFIPNKQKGHG